jgi:hypothetical protein
LFLSCRVTATQHIVSWILRSLKCTSAPTTLCCYCCLLFIACLLYIAYSKNRDLSESSAHPSYTHSSFVWPCATQNVTQTHNLHRETANSFHTGEMFIWYRGEDSWFQCNQLKLSVWTENLIVLIARALIQAQQQWDFLNITYFQFRISVCCPCAWWIIRYDLEIKFNAFNS